ncbi:tyrosine-type recombinase/integrase [Woeseia oceani]|uniref:Integrase n=1 Tax=Woeseia oceani TaxID=1548547 RepID=A0A193LEP6_9GAMM|nr:site-specific integrase [Woeseia oceani]ANO50854.1 integrase [Woeseia oceani]
MPKLAKELSALQVKRLARPGMHAVGGVSGLYLSVKESGARSWSLRVVAGGRRREIGLGGYPTVTLEQARTRARTAREQIRQGIDPIEAKQAASDALRAADAKRLTFRQAVTAFLRTKTQEFRNPKHAKQWKTTLETYAIPRIGSLPVDQIDLAHVISVLEPIWEAKTETASRLRGRIEAVLSWATVSKHRSGENPARWKGNLEHVLPKPSKIQKVRHYPALPWQELAAFMTELRKRSGTAARALEFAILTAARSGEVRLATWDEFSFDEKVWEIPGERMKSGKTHKVPLSRPALNLLKALPRFEGSNYVFAAARGGPMSDMSLSAVTRRMKVDAVPHGFRSTFKDWCRSATNFADEVSELALAHVSTDATRAAYARDELMPKRKKLMQEWADFCGSLVTEPSLLRIRGVE